jgi:hypothetical protein
MGEKAPGYALSKVTFFSLPSGQVFYQFIRTLKWIFSVITICNAW